MAAAARPPWLRNLPPLPPMHPSKTTRSHDEVHRAHARAMAFLRKFHPDKSDDELAHALKQARGITEPAGHARLIETALLLLLG